MDTISDMFTRIRNAQMAGFESVDIPASNMKIEISRVLKDEGFILRDEVLSKRNKKLLRIFLKHGEKKPLNAINRISRPSKRVYVAKDSIPRVLSGFGIAILSTSKGILTDEAARKVGVGGEVLCYVY